MSATRIEAALLALSRKSLCDYLRLRTIDSQPVARPFEEVAEPWQWGLVYHPIAPAFEYLARPIGERGTYTGPHGFWRTFPRGHFKTGFIASLINYLLAFGRREVPLRITAAAKDKGQAKFIRDAMEREKALNPWFGKYLEINKYDAKGPGGELLIASADAPGAYGAGDDVIICDELTHWSSPALWTAVYSGSGKRPDNIVVVLTNAGYKGTWQYELMESFKQDADWDVFDQPGFWAQWMNAEKIAKVRENIIKAEGTAHAAQRLLDNIWVAGRHGAVFDPDLVESMLSPEAPEPLRLVA